MAFTPISNTVPQYEENGVAASGYFIKFYESGTTTPTAMATDSTGTTLLDKCELNTEGYPINGSGAVFIPRINIEYKIALFRNEDDANNNNLANAAWDVDSLIPGLSGVVGTDFDQIPLNADIVYPVESVQNISGLVGEQDNQQISLKGWHPDSDVGGGILYWDSTKPKSEHNGGTVFSPTVPFSAATGDYLGGVGETDAGGSGCWVRVINSSSLFTSEFGAMGNGIADETIALQSACDVMSAMGGGEVLAPKGMYMIDMLNTQNPSLAGGLNIPSNVHFKGVGPSTVLKGIPISGTSNFVYVVNFENSENAKLSLVTVDASKPDGETDEKQWHGIRWDGDTDKCSVDDVTIINGKGDGIWIVKNPGYGVVPRRGSINNVRISGFNRQAIALVEGDGFRITNCSSDQTLDIEADSPNGRVNQNHFVENNDFNKIRVSPLTGLSGVKTNIIVENNRCNELSTWGGDGDIMTNNIVKGPIVVSQCGTVTFAGGSCYHIDQNVTNSTSVKKLIIDKVLVISPTELIGIELKDVVDAEISPRITLTAVGSRGIVQVNNSTQEEGVINIEGGFIESESHCVDIAVVGIANTTHSIKRGSLKSVSGRSISKIGASHIGRVVLDDNDIYAQPVIRNSVSIMSRGNRFHGVDNINYDFNTGESISMINDTYYGSAPTVALSSNNLSGSLVLKDLSGGDVILGSSSFSFTSTTALDVFINDIETNSDTPYSGLTATLRAGSRVKFVGSGAKYARWWNGSAWVNLS